VRPPQTQQVHRNRSSSNQSRRRSSSANRYPIHVSSNHHDAQYYHHPRSSRPEDPDTGSVASAPSLKQFKNKEFREPPSKRSGAKKLYRDDCPPSSKKSHTATPQKHVKTARKVIDGMYEGATNQTRVLDHECSNTLLPLSYLDIHRASASESSGGHERRIIAITNACAEFDHGDELKHNIELQNGAANVLTRLLSMTDDDDEIRMICAAIEMVFRAQSTHVHVAFDKCGSMMVPIVLRLLERAENGNMKHADVSILNITKTLLYISRVSELRLYLARSQGMLDAMRRVATSILNPECRVARIRIVANLVNCEDNKVMLLEHEGFLDSLLRIAHLDLSDSAREYAGVALMDLASAPANQVPMAKNQKLLGTLVKMVLIEKVAATRESAITALQNLAFTKENRARLVTFKQGIVLEALKKALSSDKNDKARRRAAGALTNLACDETAEIMGKHKGLPDTLAIVSTKDDSKEVQTRAAMALTKLAASITIKMSCYETLLDALVVASLSRSTNSVSAVLRVKARDPENRESMARHPGILDTLADICINVGSDIKDKDNAMRAIMHLTNEGNNRKAMCNKTLLDALVKGASLEEPKLVEIRDSAVRAIERLATEFSNRASMASHPGLLVAVAKATEREAKLEEAGAKAEHAFLAKPLLMSLLVAM
jgi:hypothetical protein